MKKVVILDDGISYFTDPAKIQRVYGRFWDEGIPICLAVTPAIKGTARLADNPLAYDGSLAIAKHGDSSPFKVSSNTILCSYLNVMAEQRLVEICLRGYDGTANEFDTDDDILLQQKIEEGKSELQHAFPMADINTFVIPQNTYSQTAIDLLTEYDFNICAYQSSKLPVLSQQLPLTDDRALFHYGTRILADNTSDATMILDALSAQDFNILHQAYWSLFDDKQVNDKYDVWTTIVSHLLTLPDTIIDSFSFI
ncbi:MAG: DUF2334 domain-containing protein [Phototrophicaceae bacterium]